jgi:hypothetical protein
MLFFACYNQKYKENIRVSKIRVFAIFDYGFSNENNVEYNGMKRIKTEQKI